MKKAVTIFRELRTNKEKMHFNPSCRSCWSTNFTKPSGIVRTLDTCANLYNCDKCRDKRECNRLYAILINANKIK